MTQPVCDGHRAGRYVAKTAPHICACRHLDVATKEDRRHHSLAHFGVRIDLCPQQLDQHRRALRVPDEDDGTAMVVVGQVVLPSRQHTVVRRRDHLRGKGFAVGERRRRGLSVHRGPHVAHRGELRGLALGDVGLVGLDRKVGVEARLLRHGRIHVEAVESLGVCGLRRGEERALEAGRRHAGGGPGGGARVGRMAWSTQPDGLGTRLERTLGRADVRVAGNDGRRHPEPGGQCEWRRPGGFGQVVRPRSPLSSLPFLSGLQRRIGARLGADLRDVCAPCSARPGSRAPGQRTDNDRRAPRVDGGAEQ